MNKAILGKKLGMTQVFTEDGKMIPVTVVEAGPCSVVQKKTLEKDGYIALQIGFGSIREKLVNKPLKGHFAKANAALARNLKEFKFENSDNFELGSVIKADIFADGDVVDVSGVSKGKGFQGVIKRHGQHRGPMAHGSRYHRRPGSMGACSTPSKVFKGKRLPGHMGRKSVTIQNLKIVKVDADNNIILVKGAIPGARGSAVSIKEAVKQAN